MSRTLADLEASCALWRELSSSLVAAGHAAVSAARLCDQVGWSMEAAILADMANDVAGLLSDTVMPYLEGRHEEYFASRSEVERLEDDLGGVA